MYDIEDLHSDLEWYWDDESQTLNHPLVHAFGWDLEKANKVYEQKTTKIQNAFSERNWKKLIRLYNRPYRPDALFALLDSNELSSAEMWPLISFVWCDTESVHDHQQEWQKVWQSCCRDRHLVMKEKERRRLAGLRSELIVWRGVNHHEAVRGLSWTLDRSMAVRFAYRFADHTDPVLLACGCISRVNVAAYLNCRREQEIVAMPQSVRGIEVQQLPYKSRRAEPGEIPG